MAYVVIKEYGRTRKATADYLGITPNTLDRWLKDAEIAGLRNELVKARAELMALGCSEQVLIEEDVIEIKINE